MRGINLSLMKKKNSVLLNWLSFNFVQKKIGWILKYWKYESCNYQNKRHLFIHLKLQVIFQYLLNQTQISFVDEEMKQTTSKRNNKPKQWCAREKRLVRKKKGQEKACKPSRIPLGTSTPCWTSGEGGGGKLSEIRPQHQHMLSPAMTMLLSPFFV